MKRSSAFLILGSILLFVIFSNANAQIYVDADATGANDGSSWADAYADLQDALAVATSGDEIWVAAGTYVPTNGTDRYATFLLVKDVGHYGGFAGHETSRGERDSAANPTILSGEIGAPGNADNSHNVVTASGLVTGVLDGFTITAGNALLWGGGVDCSGCDLTFSNLVITGNQAGVGGGMACTGQPTLINVVFENNQAGSGGGLHSALAGAPYLEGCSFVGNTAGTDGGGIWSAGSEQPILTLVDCELRDNVASGKGGAIYNYDECQIDGCVLANNTAYSGGGIYNDVAALSISNTRFESNVATNSLGGGLYSIGQWPVVIVNSVFDDNGAVWGGGVALSSAAATFANVVFTGNQATADGGALNIVLSDPVVTNVSFNDNSADRNGGAMNTNQSNATLTNVIMWGNTAGLSGNEVHNFMANTPTISYSLIKGSGGSGVGWDTSMGIDGGNNIDAGPLFANPGAGDLRLTAGSPAIDAGDDSAPALPPTDLDGNPRIVGVAVDMGAYEFDPATSIDDGVVPKTTAIQSVYPNPFNPTVTMAYELDRARAVDITIYNIRGQRVRRLVNGLESAGLHRVMWDASDDAGASVATGVYLIRIETEGWTDYRKVTLLK